VVVVERESVPGYHTTGRSAATFTESYGPLAVRRLASASRAFFMDPPEGFAEHPLTAHRGLLFPARADQTASLEAAHAELLAGGETVARLEAEAVCEMVPVIRPDYVTAALHVPGARDIDVAALHQGFLRAARGAGAAVLSDAEVTAIARENGRWRVATKAGEVTARVLIDAAGAWADAVAGLAGVAPVGLEPKRRTALTIEAPEGLDVAAWPLVIDIDEQFYFKPEAGRLLVSPADETPMPPCDVQPDELDVARAIDRLMRATTIEVRRVLRRWAGLRSFVPDHLPVIGWDTEAPGFFWLAGQGGVGIMTAPAAGRLVAALALDRALPDDLLSAGVEATAFAPARLRG